MDWRSKAACSGQDVGLFFPVGSTGPALLQIEDAKSFCDRCPVTLQCLDWALAMGLDHGIFGGLTEDERRELRRPGLAARRPVPVVLEESAAVPGELMAMASDGAVHDKTVRWHASRDGDLGCQAVLLRPMTRSVREVPVGRRCRQPGCRRLWTLVDAELEATADAVRG